MAVQPKAPKREPGLASIAQARQDRARGKFTRPTPKLFLYGGAAFVLSIALYMVFSARELGDRRSKLLAKQRATAQELGPRWAALETRIEETTLALARDWPGDAVEPGVPLAELQSQPGVYLRLRVAEARDHASLREAAKDSVRDGFVGCFARATHAPDADAGAFPDQPWNLRQAYAATRILRDEWVSEVKAASDDLRLRVFEQQLDGAMKTEIPLAITMVTQARYFLLVLDEDVPEAVQADGGVPDEALQLVAHPARVALVDLRPGPHEGKAWATLRRTASASFVPAGERPITDPQVRDAMQRQVNNCALARMFLDDVRSKK